MSTRQGPEAGRRSFLSALAVYFERSSLVMIALGFAASLPYFLIFDTLSAWFRAAGLSLDVIGVRGFVAAGKLGVLGISLIS